MATIRYTDYANNVSFDLDFAGLVDLMSGSSIVSAMDGNNVFEIGISESFNIRISGMFQIDVFSTVNRGEIPPLRLQIVSSDETASAATVEQRIHALRQLYAANFLFNAGRAEEVALALKNDPSSDIEELLTVDDRLFITAASQGSLWLTVLTKTVSAFKSLAEIGPAFYPEGRQAIIERARAKTAMAQLDVEQKSDEVLFKRVNGMIELANKIEKMKDPFVREKMKEMLAKNLTILGQHPPFFPKNDGDEEGST